MPRTCGSIVLAAPPGTGSYWLQSLLQVKLGMREGPRIISKGEIALFDRHSTGENVTVTIKRNVDEWLRTWFVRFRNTSKQVYRPSMLYANWLNDSVDYVGPDFQVWLDAYLERAPGTATEIFGMFANAKHVLRTEDLVMGTIRMLRAEGVTFEEKVVMGYPRMNVTGGPHVDGWKDWGEKPEWPEGYREKVLAAG